MSGSITFGSSLHADSMSVIGFFLGCREVTLKSHFCFRDLGEKKSAGPNPYRFFLLSHSIFLTKTPISAAGEEEIEEKEGRYSLFLSLRRN